MATSVESQDTTDITTCPICLEKYSVPKYLPCLHTFCENCIETYIANYFERENIKDIQCPLCRSQVTKPKEDCEAAEWAKSLPLNFLVVELLEKQKVMRTDKQCMICERMGLTNEAKFMCTDCADLLCENCKRAHGASKTLREHEVQAIGKGNELSSCKFFKNKCLIHKNEDIKLYCMDHAEPCCTMCVSVNHRKCEKVVTIEDAAAGYKSSKDVEELTETLEKLEEDVLNVVEERKGCVNLVENQYKECQQDIDKFFLDLEVKIRTIRDQRNAELSKKYNEASNSLETSIMIFTNQRKIIKNEKQILKACITEASAPQTMLEVQRLKRRLDDQTEFLKKQVAEIVNLSLTVQKTEIESVIKNIENMSTVSANQEKNILKLSYINVIFEINEVYRFSTSKYSGWNIYGQNADAICFKTSEDVRLHGFLVYICLDMSSFQVTASVKDEIKELCKTCTTVDSSKGENKLC